MKNYKQLFKIDTYVLSTSKVELAEMENTCDFRCGINGFPVLYEAVLDSRVETYAIMELLKKNKRNLISCSDINELTNKLEIILKGYKIKILLNYRVKGFVVEGGCSMSMDYLQVVLGRGVKDLNKDNFSTFLQEFTSILGHELVHRAQVMKAGYGRIPQLVKGVSEGEREINYFSNKKEIMAYAWQIVETISMNNFLPNDILRLLKTEGETKLIAGGIVLQKYHSLFTSSSKSLKLLYKYMYLYITQRMV